MEEKTDPTVFWTDAEIQKIYREWGTFFVRRNQLSNAGKYFDKALSLKENDEKSLFRRSISHCHDARIDEALHDAETAMKLDDHSSPICLQYSDVLFDTNEFEKCWNELNNNCRKFKGKQQMPYKERMQIVSHTLEDSMGDSLIKFMFKNQQLFAKVKKLEDEKKSQREDDRLMYRKLMELEKCDILSIPEEEKEILVPREMARRKLEAKNYVQTYFGRTSQNIFFLRNMINSKIINLKQTPKSSKLISSKSQEYDDKITIFLKMLHERSPKYNENNRSCPNPEFATARREMRLFHVQTETRRQVMEGLQQMRKARKNKNLDEIVKLADKYLRFIDVKPYRILPTRFEVTNEICNMVALTYIDRLVIPNNILHYPLTERTSALLGLVKLKDTYRKYVFGDKSTFMEPDAVDCKYVAYKKRVIHYEERCKTSQYPVERAYLQHAISMEHLTNCKYEEALTVANRTIKESIRCRNFVWIFLGKLMICRVQTATSKVEKLEESLHGCMFIAKKLDLYPFMDALREFNRLVLLDKYGEEWFKQTTRDKISNEDL